MIDAGDRPGTSPEPYEQPSPTGFCLLPAMAHPGRKRSPMDVSAEPSSHLRGARRPAEIEGTAS